MLRILEQKREFYENITNGDKRWILEELDRNDISVLPGFIQNYNLVKQFYETFYKKNRSRIVLCGINPGKKGAGKTGIPFLDFQSVSEYLPINKRNDSEISAQFIKSIIDHFGVENFFDHVYLTNLSWFGFTKKYQNRTKNLNYYDLPNGIKNHFIEGFIDEMDIVQPIKIIPLSKEVEKSLQEFKQDGKLKAEIGSRLCHPYYCAFKSKIEQAKKQYIKVIEEVM